MCLFAVAGIGLYIRLKAVEKKKENLAKENSILIADNALLETEHLKFQLQPHTLNNILANLKSTASKLNKGIGSLSETLDYILYKGNTHLVTIEDEMDFIKKYLALNDLFITEIESIKIDSSGLNIHSPYYRAPCIPHLITASLIENAFKHGDVNHPEFLSIHITLTGNLFKMQVINRIRKKPVNSNGGLGLTNMRKRLDLLVTDRYEITRYSNEQKYYSTLMIRF